MAQQKGVLKFSGTLNGLTYYQLDGAWLVRQKSSLDRVRVMGDPAFARSRVSASRFGEAARIAGRVYRLLPGSKKRHGLIGKLAGLANTSLCAGDSQEVVQEKLLRHVLSPSALEKIRKGASINGSDSSNPSLGVVRTRARARRGSSQ